MHNVDMTDLTERIPSTLISAPTVVDGIHLTLRDAISQGQLPKGYRLREMALAAHFGCSVTPVREAIRRLEHEGLVTIYPRRGAQVASLSTSEVADLYETRLVLECYAVRKAAERKPAKPELAEARAMLSRQRASLSDQEHTAPLDAEVHQALTVLAGNPVIAELASHATRQIEAVQARVGAVVPGGRNAAYKAHQEILKAIAAGDADNAESLMRKHLEWTRDAVLAQLDEAQSR